MSVFYHTPRRLNQTNLVQEAFRHQTLNVLLDTRPLVDRDGGALQCDSNVLDENAPPEQVLVAIIALKLSHLLRILDRLVDGAR